MHESETDEKKKRLTKNSETNVYILKLTYAKMRYQGDLESRLRQTVKVNLYGVTNFSFTGRLLFITSTRE